MFLFSLFISDAKMNRSTLYAVITTLVGCANPVIPTGGQKDINPPKLINNNIPSHTTNIKPNRIEFFFDENIQTTNLKEEVVISPFLSFQPLIVPHKKSIAILIDTTRLLQNVTYTISLNNSVSDLNEGNKTNYKPYLFSTGNSLDTQILYSKYVFLNSDKLNKIKAFAIDSINPGILHKASITNQTITLYGQNNNSKKIILFNDLNDNDSAEQNEARGYASTKPNDTSYILIYPTKQTSLKVWKVGTDQYKVHGLQASYLKNTITNKYGNDIYIVQDTLYCSSSTFNKIKDLPSSQLYQIPKSSETGTLYKKPQFQLSHFTTDTFTRLFYHADTILPDITFSSSQSSAHFQYTKPDINRYTITISQGSSFTIKTNSLDSFNYKPTTIQQTTLANPNNFPIHVIIKHIGSNDYLTRIIKPNQEFLLGLLKGEYEITYWNDRNGDDHITGPPVDFLFAGEETRILRNIKINGNIDFHMKLSFNKQGE